LRTVAAEGGYETVEKFPHVSAKRTSGKRDAGPRASPGQQLGDLWLWCARTIDAIRQRRTPVVPGERAVTARQTNWRHGMANKDTGYGRRWKKWLAIYAVAGVVIYLIVYLVFFSGGGGGAAGGGGLY
jgi:hypothetical protein